MKLVTGRSDVLATLQRLRAAGTALFSPNGELAAEIEGLLIGAQRFADRHGLAEVPIAIGMTGIYPDNAQFRKISTSCVTRTDLGGFDGGDVREGCEIWLRTLAVYDSLAGADGRPRFPAVRILPFIDHGWATDPEDAAMLHDPSVVERMAIIMHDASKLEEAENIRLTAAYVARFGDQVVVEGAADKIYDPADIARLKLSRDDQLSTPGAVEAFVRSTGVDLVVPNLGTEHRSVGRAGATTLRAGAGQVDPRPRRTDHGVARNLVPGRTRRRHRSGWDLQGQLLHGDGGGCRPEALSNPPGAGSGRDRRQQPVDQLGEFWP